jgi:hypothetical protein
MADREQSQTSKQQSQTSKRGMNEKPPRDLAGKGHPTSGSKGEEREHGVRNMGSVGRDEPDQSKERNTEIAVEAGHKGPGEHPHDKR